jgi:hypothetical protein
MKYISISGTTKHRMKESLPRMHVPKSQQLFVNLAIKRSKELAVIKNNAAMELGFKKDVLTLFLELSMLCFFWTERGC